MSNYSLSASIQAISIQYGSSRWLFHMINTIIQPSFHNLQIIKFRTYFKKLTLNAWPNISVFDELFIFFYLMSLKGGMNMSN